MRIEFSLPEIIRGDRFWMRLAAVLLLAMLLFDYAQSTVMPIKEAGMYDVERHNASMVELPYSMPTKHAGDQYYFRFVMPEDRLSRFFPLRIVPRGCITEVVANQQQNKLEEFGIDRRCNTKNGLSADELELPGAGAVYAVAVLDDGKNEVGLSVLRSGLFSPLWRLVFMGVAFLMWRSRNIALGLKSTTIDETADFILPLLNMAAVCFFLYVTYTAYINPAIEWDSWAYHLPIASFLWNIGGGQHGFTPSYYVQAAYAGLPVFAEWLQGALWVLFDDVRATSLINPLAFSIACIAAWRWFGVSLFWMIIGAIAFPLFAAHIVSTYKDVYTGALIVTYILAAARIYTLLKGGERMDLRKMRVLAPWLLLCASAIAVCNSKVQGWVVVMPLNGVFMLWFLYLLQSWKTRMRLVAAGLVLVVLCNYNMIHNYVKFGNPFFPRMLTLHPVSVGFDPAVPEGNWNTAASTPSYAGSGFWAQPLYFILSVTELDWNIRYVSPIYTFDMASGDNNYQGMNSRTGGLWSVLVYFHLLLLSILILRRRLWAQLNNGERFIVHSFGWVTFFCMFIPGFVELRYCFVWPILLTIITGIYFRHVSKSQQLLLAALLIASLFIAQTQLPLRRTIFATGHMPATPQQWRQAGLPWIVANIKDHQANCIYDRSVYYHMGFMYSPAIMGGDHTIYMPWISGGDCSAREVTPWKFQR